jgi:hypothetical protein
MLAREEKTMEVIERMEAMDSMTFLHIYPLTIQQIVQKQDIFQKYDHFVAVSKI